MMILVYILGAVIAFVGVILGAALANMRTSKDQVFHHARDPHLGKKVATEDEGEADNPLPDWLSQGK